MERARKWGLQMELREQIYAYVLKLNRNMYVQSVSYLIAFFIRTSLFFTCFFLPLLLLFSPAFADAFESWQKRARCVIQYLTVVKIPTKRYGLSNDIRSMCSVVKCFYSSSMLVAGNVCFCVRHRVSDSIKRSLAWGWWLETWYSEFLFTC